MSTNWFLIGSDFLHLPPEGASGDMIWAQHLLTSGVFCPQAPVVRVLTLWQEHDHEHLQPNPCHRTVGRPNISETRVPNTGRI